MSATAENTNPGETQTQFIERRKGMKIPEWAWRFVLPAMLVGFVAWLTVKFVPRDEYKADRDKMNTTLEVIQRTTSDINQKLAVMEAKNRQPEQAQTLIEHEKRIRDLERVIKP